LVLVFFLLTVQEQFRGSVTACTGNDKYCLNEVFSCNSEQQGLHLLHLMLIAHWRHIKCLSVLPNVILLFCVCVCVCVDLLGSVCCAYLRNVSAVLASHGYLKDLLERHITSALLTVLLRSKQSQRSQVQILVSIVNRGSFFR
jgi:hypothetical protein